MANLTTAQSYFHEEAALIRQSGKIDTGCKNLYKETSRLGNEKKEKKGKLT